MHEFAIALCERRFTPGPPRNAYFLPELVVSQLIRKYLIIHLINSF